MGGLKWFLCRCDASEPNDLLIIFNVHVVTIKVHKSNFQCNFNAIFTRKFHPREI